MRTPGLSAVGLALLASAAGCSFDNTTAPAATIPLTARTSIALGTGFSCGVATSHVAYCWGRNESGQGGNGNTIWTGLPVAVALASPVAAISASEATVCALSTTGSASCWGFVPDGLKFETTRATPVDIESPTPLVSLTVGSAFACGLDKDGNAYCWGLNDHGQLGVGDTTSRAAATLVMGGVKFTQIAAGYAHVCGTSAGGTVYCWGDNAYNETGLAGRTKFLVQPTAVETDVPMRSVTAGVTFTCAISFKGTAYCWGSNVGGQLGDGTVKSHASPAPVAGDLQFTALAASRGNSTLAHTCGITSKRVLYCWGANSSGETGGPAETTCIGFGIAAVCNTLPVFVRSSVASVAVDVGRDHSCAIAAAGDMECWGDNSQGEMGDGTRSNPAKPEIPTGHLRFH